MNRTATLVAALAGATALGAGAAIASYSAISGGSGGTTTVMREVTVSQQPASRSSGLSVNQVYRAASGGVVEITVSGPVGQAQGSGFVYDSNGDIVTNEHVVSGASSISVSFPNGSSYDAHVVGTDSSTDLAVIKVDAPGSVLVPLSLGDSAALVVGQPVVAIGAPFGLDETVTSGIVSALHRQITAPNQFAITDAIQTDAAINHGNSGGPLLDLNGRVVGVTAQIKSDSGGNEGVGFAVPSNTVRSVVTQILSTGKAEHAYLGVQLSSTSSAARIAAVRPGTPAASAHLQSGDVVTAIDGKKIASSAELQSAIAAKKPGETISLTYTRSGQSHTVSVKLATRPSNPS